MALVKSWRRRHQHSRWERRRERGKPPERNRIFKTVNIFQTPTFERKKKIANNERNKWIIGIQLGGFQVSEKNGICRLKVTAESFLSGPVNTRRRPSLAAGKEILPGGSPIPCPCSPARNFRLQFKPLFPSLSERRLGADERRGLAVPQPRGCGGLWGAEGALRPVGAGPGSSSPHRAPHLPASSWWTHRSSVFFQQPPP